VSRRSSVASSHREIRRQEQCTSSYPLRIRRTEYCERQQKAGQVDNAFLLAGLIMGFSIAAPVGPIGVLCIRRTLSEGRRAGLLTGLGAATADAIYGCIAGFGLVFISSVLVSQRIWLRFFGGLFLCYLGIKTFLAKPAEQVASIERNDLISAYVSTFFLTLTNPMTIVSFVGIFAGLGLASGGDWVSATVLVLGVFLGSALWWFILSGAVGLCRTRFNPRWMQWVNRISGMIIAGFGILILLSLGM
jgi:threonine/homoserine/homoserine lactone efflux protein